MESTDYIATEGEDNYVTMPTEDDHGNILVKVYT